MGCDGLGLQSLGATRHIPIPASIGDRNTSENALVHHWVEQNHLLRITSKTAVICLILKASLAQC